MVVQDLLPVSGAPRSARNIITDACGRWNLLHVVGPASLIVSELASNVVDHAHTIMTLRATVHPSALHLAMQDGSSAPPVLRTSTVPTERGRGLQLVEAVSTAWGYRLEHGGKTVWATLDLAIPEQRHGS
jgi:hypothetical protein